MKEFCLLTSFITSMKPRLTYLLRTGLSSVRPANNRHSPNPDSRQTHLKRFASHQPFCLPSFLVGGLFFTLTTNSTTIQEARKEPRSLALYLCGPLPAGDSASFPVGESKQTDPLHCTVAVAVEPVSPLDLGGCLQPSAQDDQGGE